MEFAGCDDEPLFGECGEAKLIVSLSFGTQALYKWKGKFCPCKEGGSCWLGHGDVLVMKGQCQDEFLHCTDPGLERERINVTFRWIRKHATSRALRTGVACCLPTCGQVHPLLLQVCGRKVFFWLSGYSLEPLVHMGGTSLASLPFMCAGIGLRRCAFCWTRPSGGGRWGHNLRNLRGVCWTAHETACQIGEGIWKTHGFKLYMLALVERPSLHSYDACMVFGLKGHSGEIAGKHKVRPLFLLDKVFLFNRNSSVRFWGLVFWHSWIGRARNPGPVPHHFAVKVFNVGGWLTHGDLTLEARVDSLAVVEHTLIPARCGVGGLGLKVRGLLLFGHLPLRILPMLVMLGCVCCEHEGCPCCSAHLCHCSVWAFL